jgi:hypothetical protein
MMKVPVLFQGGALVFGADVRGGMSRAAATPKPALIARTT